jgi:hypothetical protein
VANGGIDVANPGSDEVCGSADIAVKGECGSECTRSRKLRRHASLRKLGQCKPGNLHGGMTNRKLANAEFKSRHSGYELLRAPGAAARWRGESHVALLA